MSGSDYTFKCDKCGYTVTVSAPELTDEQKKKLHVCSTVKPKVNSGKKKKKHKKKKIA